jgi:hypothetical protein
MDSIIFFLDRIYKIDGIFFACNDRPYGRKTNGRWNVPSAFSRATPYFFEPSRKRRIFDLELSALSYTPYAFSHRPFALTFEL